MPEAEPLQFAVNDAELRGPRFERVLAQASASLAKDPDLHLLIVGHADEDNSDEYNQALSQRRAEHARDALLAIDESLAEQLHVEARGEWDASEAGDDEAAKSRNRRVELRFFYPRQCEPGFDASFIACEWARLPNPVTVVADPPAATQQPPSPSPGPKPLRPRERQDFRGPYIAGIGGYAISSSDDLRQHGRWGLGAGYLWGFGSEFRIGAGLNFDHLIDVGYLFPPDNCRTRDCDRIDRSRIRVAPELRLGGAQRGVMAWLRLSGGLLLEHREARLSQPSSLDGTPPPAEILAPEQWTAGAVVGIGPGVAIALTAHLFLLFEATVTYSTSRGTGGTGWSGAGIYDAGAGFGWVF